MESARVMGGQASHNVPTKTKRWQVNVGKRFWLCVAAVLTLVGHLVFDAVTLYRQSLTQGGSPYDLNARRLTPRVVLVVLDSWPERMLVDGRLMPKLWARSQQGASGVLWAPRQTATVAGILSLSTGVQPGGLSAVGLISSSRFEGWTIFDDVAARGERVSFHGGPSWVVQFGDRSQGSMRETGHGPLFREEDLEGLAHSRAAMLSARPPTLSVVHITETDVAAHQYGTLRPEYAAVLRHWDDQLDSYLDAVLPTGATVIVTADHGCDEVGGHGGPAAIFRRVPLVMMGQGVVPGARVEMASADMPVTLATLLGLRAPDAAMAVPAVRALDLTPAERQRLVWTAYARTVLQGQALGKQPTLRAQAEAALPRDWAQAQGPVTEAQANEAIDRVQKRFAELEPLLSNSRLTQTSDWVFSVVVLCLAAAFAWMGRPAGPHARRVHGGAMVLGLLLWSAMEGLLMARVALLPRWRDGSLAGPQVKWVLLGLALVGVVALVVVWLSRRRWLSWAQTWPDVVLALVFVLAAVTKAMSSVGLLTCGLAAVLFLSRPWPRLWRHAAWLLVGGYALVAPTLYNWLGEDLWVRYKVGLAIALGGMAVAMWLDGRLSRPAQAAQAERPVWLWPVLGLGLALQPAAGFYLPQPDAALERWLATAVVLGLVALVSWADGRWRAAWGLAAVLLAFWWWGEAWAWGLYLGLGLTVVVTALGVWRSRGVAPDSDAWPARVGWLMAGCLTLLMLLTRPQLVPSLLAMLALFGAFISLEARLGLSLGLRLMLVAVTWVAARYCLFELFGYATSPSPVYHLKHLDLMPAYLGDATRHILGASGLVMLKVWLGAGVLWLWTLGRPAWREHADDLVLLVAALLTVEVAQAALRASLAVGAVSYQYDQAAFTLVVHTGLLVFALLAYGVLRAWSGHGRAWVSAR
ncbi:MAG: hypothetical protein RI907_395 [Pseudomonadota bacterium]|jgi:hypothetical protein